MLFFKLVCHPHVYRKPQGEADASMEQQGATGPEAIENAGIARLEYLKACIDESLRSINPTHLVSSAKHLPRVFRSASAGSPETSTSGRRTTSSCATHAPLRSRTSPSRRGEVDHATGRNTHRRVCPYVILDRSLLIPRQTVGVDESQASDGADCSQVRYCVCAGTAAPRVPRRYFRSFYAGYAESGSCLYANEGLERVGVVVVVPNKPHNHAYNSFVSIVLERYAQGPFN